MRKQFTITLITLLLCSLALQARSQEAQSQSRLEMDLVGLYNPLGVSLSWKVLQREVYQRSDNVLWDGLYYQYGVQGGFTPAYSRAGLHLEWMPVAVLQLRLQSERYFFNGDFGSLLDFPSATAPFDDADVEARAGEEVSGTGQRDMASLILRAKFGNLVLRNVTDLARYEFPGNGPYYLEREYELLMATRDTLLANQFYLLFDLNRSDGSLLVGPYHDYVRLQESGLRRERLGFTCYREYQQALGPFHSPRWYLQTGYYINEPNRDAEYYLVVGIGGDIHF